MATVISYNDHYIIIDAGSKVFSSDLAPHSAEGIVGYDYYYYNNLHLYRFGEAYSAEDWQTKRHKMFLAKLSEEHGWIKREADTILPKIGSKVFVIPNHSCVVANLTSVFTVFNTPDGKIQTWNVHARGQVR
jgi:D-serine deaminase-like pyridoxal phosphate-dependent protein